MATGKKLPVGWRCLEHGQPNSAFFSTIITEPLETQTCSLVIWANGLLTMVFNEGPTWMDGKRLFIPCVCLPKAEECKRLFVVQKEHTTYVVHVVFRWYHNHTFDSSQVWYFHYFRCFVFSVLLRTAFRDILSIFWGSKWGSPPTSELDTSISSAV